MRNKPPYFFKLILLLITISSTASLLDQAKADDLIFLVENIYPQETGSNPANFIALNDTLFFTAETAGRGTELWRSDATTAGTHQVKDIYMGSNGSNPAHLTKMGDVLFFAAADAGHGTELWTSDGTQAGTTLVKDINAQGIGDDSFPGHLVVAGDALFFAADDGLTGAELWTSDGTEAGSVRVKDIRFGGQGSSPANLTAVKERLFFTADDGQAGVELWISDGTEAGTIQVKDINPSGGSNPTYLTPVADTLFFTAYDGQTGVELWQSDGTVTGTVRVKDIYPGGASSLPTNLAAVNGTLFFTANDGVHGHELWQSDGSEAGTIQLKNIRPEELSSGPAELIDVNGTLFFQANDGDHGRELWQSDGTAAGTILVKDINPTGNATPAHLTAVNEILFFTANDGRTGVELWRSDGTEEGTFQVRDIHSDILGSTPAHLTAVNDILFFKANDGVNGAELWAMAHPAITLTATTDRDTAEVGQSIIYTYWITNSGNIYLNNINANDARQGLISLEQTGLAPGAGLRKSFTYEVVAEDLPGPLTNNVTVTSTPAADLQLNATATTTVSLITQPDIAIAATANVETANVGQTIEYTYHLTNSGNIDLVNLEARDSRLGKLSLDQTTLIPGQKITQSLSYTVREVDLPGPLVNTVTVTGRSILGADVSDTADVSVALKKISPPARFSSIYLPLIVSPAPPPPKKGVGVVIFPACDDVEALKAHWYLNWNYRPDPTCGPENAAKFVPRLYNADSIQFLDEAIENAKASGWLMGFSEPNLPWQGDLNPSQAAILWRQIEIAADGTGIKLVSPSPNQWDPNRDGLPHGHQWTWVMVDEYQARFGTKPRFDAIAWNIYQDNPEAIKAYLTTRHTEMLARGYDVPVWIIEYGGECWNSGDHTGNETVMTEITTWFNQTPWIGRYAWYANRLDGANHNATNYQSCSLIDAQTGDLTPLGQIYLQY